MRGDVWELLGAWRASLKVGDRFVAAITPVPIMFSRRIR